MSLLLAFAFCVQDKAAAEKALDEIAAAMKDAAAVAFDVKFKYEDQTYTTKVSLKRPNFVRSEDDSSLTVLDGKTYWYYAKADNQYTSFDQPEDGAAQMASPLSDLYFGKSGKDLLENADSVTADPEKRTIGWKVEDEGYWTEWKVTVDDKKTVVRIVSTYGSEDQEPYTQDMEISGFTTTPAVGDDTFAFKPPEGATVMDPNSDYEASLLAAGADAPDFEAPDLDDKKLKLSSLKGKVVLLNFWFYG